MRAVSQLRVVVLVTIMFVASVAAETYQLNDGTTVSGELVSPNELGVLLRLPDGSYSERIPWVRFSQADLKELAENPRLKQFVEPFIEVQAEEQPKKLEINVKPVTRMDRPANASFVRAFLASSIGLALVLVVYAANIFAAYEISVIRAFPAPLVCGVAAVFPIIGPAIFLCLPTRLRTTEHALAEAAAAQQTRAQVAAEIAAASAALGVGHDEHGAAATAAELPPTQLFKRGEFVFNRRFFETKFAGFFGVLRREADKDMVLTIKTPHGLFTVERFTRITGNEMYFLTKRGAGMAEMTVPFAEVQEVELRHKDAPPKLTDR
ncbi:MAG: hypothetical protein N2379_02835 [Verrucomicrobiae bacterium]|nr:hypothetical protein [Verrucomicrobiae bacterium]